MIARYIRAIKSNLKVRGSGRPKRTAEAGTSDRHSFYFLLSTFYFLLSPAVGASTIQGAPSEPFASKLVSNYYFSSLSTC